MTENELSSTHLRMRPLGLTDIDDIAALHSDPKVQLGRTGGANREPRSETEAWLNRALAVAHGGGLGMFRIEHRATGEFVGRGGLRGEGSTGQIEIAYALRVEYWGVGLGTEVGQILWKHAARSGLTLVVGDVLADNIASQRILSGLGRSMTFEHRGSDGKVDFFRFEGKPSVGGSTEGSFRS